MKTGAAELFSVDADDGPAVLYLVRAPLGCGLLSEPVAVGDVVASESVAVALDGSVAG